MNQYTYVAQTDSGTLQHGKITCVSPADAKEKLSQRGRRLVSIQRVSKTTSSPHKRFTDFWRRKFWAVSTPDIILMLQQLSVMLSSGLELTASLQELSRHNPKRRVQRLCLQISASVEQGKSLSKAISETKSFPTVVAKLAHVGETTGELSVTLDRAADFIERRRQAISELASALAYPFAVAIAACLVAGYMVVSVIPKIAVFLRSMGRTLPSMTQSLLDISSFAQAYLPHAIVLSVTGGIGLAFVYAWEPGRYRIDQGLLRVPLIGRMLRMAETQQLASSLALMLRSGVVLQEALGTASTLHRNQYLAKKVTRSRQQLIAGSDLASALSGPAFSPMLLSMVSVGEQTGDLPNALEHVAKYYATQLTSKLKRFGKVIEPTIIVVVGGVVAYVYVAFFMAMLSTGGNFN